MIAVLAARSDAIFQLRVALCLGALVGLGFVLVAALPRRTRKDNQEARLLERLRRSGW